jgi:hypothetical protein
MVTRMKTTLDVPDSLYRQIKARAALKGQTIRSFFLDAIQDKLRVEREGSDKTTGWRSVFGKANKDDISQLQQLLDDDFSAIDTEEWK